MVLPSPRQTRRKGKDDVKNKTKSIIETVETEHEDEGNQPLNEDLTEEELARLDRQMEETYRTGATPFMDALSSGKESFEDLQEIFLHEVVRRLGAEVELFDDNLFEHIERGFKRGRSAEQCVAEWRTRLS